MDDGDFKRVLQRILRLEWESQSLSGFISTHGNQQSDSRQGNHHASWKVFGNAEDLLRGNNTVHNGNNSFNKYKKHFYVSLLVLAVWHCEEVFSAEILQKVQLLLCRTTQVK